MKTLGFAILVILAILLMVRSGWAACDFDDTDKLLLAGATAAIVVDWTQTREFLTKEDRQGRSVYYETNPLFGRHPAPEQTNLRAGGALLLTWLGACLLEREPRRVMLGMVIGVELVVINGNYQLTGTYGF